METYDKHIDFYKNLEPDLKKTEHDLWAKIEEETKHKSQIKIGWFNTLKYSFAATILLLLGITLVMRYYNRSVTTNKGEHIAHTLPDGSLIKLNAETSVAYHPYWWRFKREIHFVGEAFFEVENLTGRKEAGKQFSVISSEGRTTVLGTSFNIFARNSDYLVYCKTGKVNVSSTKHDIEFEITAGEIAFIDNENKEGRKKEGRKRDYLSWTDNNLSFTDVSLRKVFDEIERQYDIEIESTVSIDALIFGAFFNKPQTPEQVLDLICIQFDLTFEKIKTREYKISKK